MSVLFTPLEFGTTTIQNRIGTIANSRHFSVLNVPSEVMQKYYAQRALGGQHVLACTNDYAERLGVEYAPGIRDKNQVAGWKKITNAMHEPGNKLYCQLFHPGRLSHPDAPEQIAAGVLTSAQHVHGPSAIATRGAGKFRFIPGNPGFVTVRFKLTHFHQFPTDSTFQPTEIPDPVVIIAQFKAAAIKAKAPPVHGTYGYLVEQFFTSTAKQRTDKWGDSPENRVRFALEVLREMFDVWGAKRRV
ncbi:hypothetical protein DFH09DRAFT_1096582 [Mycena vulgaris]|nr:hypothetical protein DFH09DRAFT_1096582 [Mycena vulgaris]